MSSPQVVLDDDFETGDIDDTDRWAFQTAATAQTAEIDEGIALIATGATQTNCWHTDKIPQDTEQQIEASVVAYVEGTNKHVGLWLRLDDTVAVTSFAPDRGYLCRLSYEASSVRSLEIIRINSGHVEVVLGTVADVGTAGTDKMVEVSSSDLGVLQTLRFTVSEEEFGVRLRAFVNEDDDENPDLSVLDLGLAASGSVPVRDAGLWGFEIVSDPAEVGIDRVKAKDRFIIPVEDVHSTRTLSQLRTDLNDEITRGGNRNLADAYLNRQLNLAQEEVMRIVGRTSMFTLREKALVLTADSSDNQIVEMPSYVEAVEEFMTSPGRRPIGHALIAVNETNTALKLRLSVNLSGETVIVRYHTKWNNMTSDDDRSIVPRLFDEAIILGAAKRIGRRGQDQRWYQTIIAEYGFTLKTIKKYLNRQAIMERKRFRPAPIVNGADARDTRYVSDPTDLWRWP